MSLVSIESTQHGYQHFLAKITSACEALQRGPGCTCVPVIFSSRSMGLRVDESKLYAWGCPVCDPSMRSKRAECFRIWRDGKLIDIMREDMMLRGQVLNGRGFAAEEVEIEKPRSVEYES